MNLALRKHMSSCLGAKQKTRFKNLYAKNVLMFFTAISFSLISGCNQITSQTDSSQPSQENNQPQITPAYKIKNLLNAEFTLQREGPSEAFELFYELASQSEDIVIIERLASIAVASQDDNYIERSTNLWLANEPRSEQAYALKLQVLVKNKRTEETATLLANAIRHKIPLRFLPLYLENHVRDNEKVQTLNDAIATLPPKYQENQYIQLSYAHTLFLIGQYEPAITLSKKRLARSDTEKSEVLYLILSYSQKNLGKLDEAIETLLTANQEFPLNTRILSPLIDFLVENERPQQATTVYKQAVLESSEQLQVGINFIRTLLEYKHPQKALDIANSLPEEQLGLSHQIQFLTAIAAAELGNKKQAIEIMSQVSGNLRSNATQQMALWLYDEEQENLINNIVLNRTLRENLPEQIAFISQLHEEKGHLELAYDLLNHSLNTLPESNILRYRKALLAERLGNWPTTEIELKTLLQKDPGNPQYLNALGYTLLTRTERLDEAMNYIELAYEQEANDPAVIDSLGWGHFLKGELEQSSYYLKKAWDILPDAEIAAHYGESLWRQRHYKQAIEIWGAALETAPKNPLLLNTIKRLSPSLLEKNTQEKTS
ncbi:MAG: tetratricopeptide repeat protein [Marinomonas colpomeniae]